MLTPAATPRVAALLVDASAIGGHGDAAIRTEFARMLDQVGDPEVAASLTRSWARDPGRREPLIARFEAHRQAGWDPSTAARIAAAIEIDGARPVRFERKLRGATERVGDPAAGALLASAWADTDFTMGRLLELHSQAGAATHDTLAAARLVDAWTYENGDMSDLVAVHRAALGVVHDHDAASRVAHAWGAVDDVDDQEVIATYRAFNQGVGDARTAATLTRSWANGDVHAIDLLNDHRIFERRLGHLLPGGQERLGEAYRRVNAGAPTDDDLDALVDAYGYQHMRGLLPDGDWPTLARGFEAAVRRGEADGAIPLVLEDIRRQLDHLPQDPQLRVARDSAQELLVRNSHRIQERRGLVDRIRDLLRRVDPNPGYRGHADYAEIGRLMSLMSLLGRAADSPPVTAAAPVSPAAHAGAIDW